MIARSESSDKVLTGRPMATTDWRRAGARVMTLLGLVLSPVAAWAQLECATAGEVYKHVSQVEVTSNTDKALQAAFMLAVRNLAEVHAKLVLVTDVKPPLLICASPKVNAFVVERGKPIFVLTGFLREFGHDKDILAAMLAHELGHLERDHAGYRARAMGVFEYNARLAAGAVLSRSYKYDEARRVAAREYQRQFFAFSREQETDADSHGTIILSRAGFQPRATIKALSGLLAVQGHRTNEWSDTHPGLFERILLVQPRVYDEESDQLARALAEQGNRAALARQINSWLKSLPESGNAWFHKAVFLEKLRSAHTIEAYERSLGSNGPSISRTEEDLAEVWVALCVGLYQSGYKVESASCSRRIRYSELRAQYRAATFGDGLVIGGEEPPASGLLTARDRDGTKIITNDSTMLTRRGLPATHSLAPWRPIRFPPTEVDRPLVER